MKILYPNKITAVVADEQNANWLDDNVLDEHPRKLWKATSEDAQLKLTVSGGSDTLAIFALNLTGVTVTIKDATETTTLVGPTTYNLRVIDTYQDLILDNYLQYTQYWIEYPYQGQAVVIILDCESSVEFCEIGVTVAGVARTFHDPQYGIKQGLVDYSIVRELNNGATYAKKRDIVRRFSATIQVDRDRSFWDFMKKVARELGPTPAAWRLTKQDNQDWVIYGRFDGMPDGTHASVKKSLINFSILEVL